MSRKIEAEEKSAPVYRSVDAIKKALGKLSETTNEDVRDVIRGTIAFMEARKLSVTAMQKELKECKSGILTVGHVAYFGVAEAIYRSKADGVGKCDPSKVITMANRLQVVYGKDRALTRITELVAAGIPFLMWGEKDEDGNRPVPTIAEHRAAKAAESGKDGNGNEDGKGDAPATVSKEVKSLDDVVLLTLTILGKHKEWRTTSQPEAVAELVAILNSVTEAR